MEKKKKSQAPLKITGLPEDWQDRIKAYLAAQVEAGGTLYGIREDGAYFARTKDGDRVLGYPGLKSD